jgi:hypothetical protein
LNHKIEHELGEIVYLITDPDQFERMVTGIILRPNNQVIYEISFMNSETQHYSIEFTSERDFKKATSN